MKEISPLAVSVLPNAHFSTINSEFYENPRERFFFPIIQLYPNYTSMEILVRLLADTQLYIIYSVAQFALAAKTLRVRFVKVYNIA